MTVDTPVGPSRSALRRLRELRRDGLADNRREVRELLAGMADADELEHAGRLLSGRHLADLADDEALAAQRLVVYGNSTLDALPGLITSAGVRVGLAVTAHSTGFDSWRTDVLAGAASVAHLAPAPVLLVLDDSAVFGAVRNRVDADEVTAACAAFPAEVARWVDRVREALGSTVVLVTVPLSPLRRDAVIDYQNSARVNAAWARMNAALLDLAGTGVVVLSHEALAERAGEVHPSHRLRHIAGVAFSSAYLAELASEVARILLARLGRARKCLVLDLDGTMWDGVVGDDGVGALRVGGAYPGGAHLELQRLASDLADQGVLLAVASKNHEEIALAALEDHPDMLLRQDAFLAHRINFDPKPANLDALARELNIDVSAMVFVDDSRLERGLMATMQPAVAVVDVGDDAAAFAARVAASGAFNLLTRTDEDANRPAMYRADRARTALRESAGDLESYLHGLGMVLELLPAVPHHVVRTAQLFGKTNQFNLTGRRYTTDDISRLSARGSRFVVGRLRDAFDDSGIVIAAAVSVPDETTWSIDNMVLSCRAFSRGIEGAVLAAIVAGAAADGRITVRAGFVPTAKNRAFAGFYASAGFTRTRDGDASGATAWERGAHPMPAPTWLTVSHSPEVFDVRA